MLLALWLDQLHAKGHIWVSCLLVDVLFHGQCNKDILVVHSDSILGVFVGQQDALLALFDFASLEALVSDGIAVDIAD